MGKIEITAEKCKGCRLCVVNCKLGLIKVSGKLNKRGVFPAVFDGKGKCTGCTMCAIICPDCCIEVFK